MAKESFTVYVDGVDWQHEIDAVEYGSKVYPDLEAMKEYSPCYETCGVVKCTITLEEWVVPQDWSKGKTVTASLDDLKKNVDLQRLESALRHKEYLESLVKKQEARVEVIKSKLKENENGN